MMGRKNDALGSALHGGMQVIFADPSDFAEAGQATTPIWAARRFQKTFNAINYAMPTLAPKTCQVVTQG
jgi:hypothetical protein